MSDIIILKNIILFVMLSKLIDNYTSSFKCFHSF